ncbi:growth factor receptor-bound protein 10-like isoform X1 [Carassius carassius]|uniref:growth factor receptor-bound protein 10-like isoform X1 n=2 Tax=Carassius carassius TaxID=217509 RepID=UPI002868B581|nr:growth factor receptor-bound protein 10-like isoform X1 [Carassius carassius]
MALAGCPDYFPHHPNYQGNVDRTPSRRPSNLIGSSFQQSSNRNSLNHPEDDVDLEALVNDMASLSSYESIYATCGTQHADSAPLLHSTDGNGLHGNRVAPLPRAPSNKVTAPHTPAHKLRRSQPMHIQAVRRLQEEELQVRPASLPAIPNPFPELCSPSGSPVLSPGSLPQPSEPHIIKVFSEDGVGRVVEVTADMTARDVCQFLVYKNHCLDDNCWSLVEHHSLLGLERCLEDHELVVPVQACMSPESKFLFRKNYAKYEFFRNPLNFFPEQMVAWCQETNGSIPPSQLLQNFLNSSSCPEIQGFLYMKDTGRKSWKKLYMFLRRSGLYCSTKGMSKEPRHLQLLSDLEDSNIFTVTTGRKMHNAPTDYQFSIKPSKGRTELKELKMLCAEDEQSRTCWMTAFRLLKFGILLYQNYKSPLQRKTAISNFTTPVRSVSENSLVAMDFSGRTGRVIDNPLEAQSAAMEEGHTWRKRSQRMNVLGSPSPLHPSPLSSVIHRTQLWFHGRIMREESHRMIMQQGQVDGLFLLRDSQSNPKAFVLTLCHHQKIKHFQILPFEEDGQVFFSLDDGSTKFTDLIHLVEFYQLNRGVLPCKLKHPCTMVAL